MSKTSIIIYFLAIALFTGCKKDEFNFASTSIPSVPVTVTNLYAMTNAVPTVATSVSGGGAITITLAIPASSGRSIKEITRISTATTTANYRVVQVTTGLYNTAPISGSGTSVTFSTTLTEYSGKTGAAVPATPGTATSFLGRYFYFLVTLDNGEQLQPVPVRVYVAI